MQEKLRDKPQTQAPDADELRRLDAWWRAANYLSVGQIYLMDNPLLREPLRREHTKPRLLGHWGTTPGLNFIYAHLNRVIKARDLDIIYICGPGHGGPGMVANTWLEGTYSEIYPHITEDARGMGLLFRQFSFPGGIPSHASPDTPGSIHEGGELGYSLVHAYGAACDNPNLIVACVIGDGEAETGPLAASWRCNTFLNPATDGAVLPILHLNGYKIANPTILGRLPDGDVVDFFRAYGYEPMLVAGSEPETMHQKMARILDDAIDRIWAIQQSARNKPPGNATVASASGAASEVPRWPMIVLRTPKGWTGPKQVDGKKVEGFWRSHQVPLAEVRTNSHHLHLLEEWMRSYRPQELFDENGRLVEEIARMAPEGDRRMSANPHANGGLLRRELRLPDFRSYAVSVANPGTLNAEGTRIAGAYLRDVERLNAANRNFRLVGPDETSSNRLDAVFEATDRAWMERLEPYDVHLSRDGRVIEVLSEHV
ncbi:MAG: phosphoketolase family protein, partial [Bradyrhizobiaceae bacterium]|nr:phosphoketolase family protein [Bradyrhizobiaceae bacterium]